MRRPGLQHALTELRAGEAQVLVVAKLDRLSRSVVDFVNLMARSQREGWAVLVLDLGVDTTTPSGELVVNVMAVLAQWERRVISERTKQALAQARANGKQLGRPSTVPASTRRRVLKLHQGGMGYGAIAKELNVKRVPPPGTGRQWHPTSVRNLIKREEARA